MTENTPDAVKVAAKVAEQICEGVALFEAERRRIHQAAEAGARAMQAALAGRVRVKPMDLSNVLNAAFNFGLSGGKWEDFSLDAHPGYRRILSALEPAGAQEGAASPIAAMAVTLQAVAEEGVFVPDSLTAPDVPGLVERLREPGRRYFDGIDYQEEKRPNRDGEEAADTIEVLQAMVETEPVTSTPELTVLIENLLAIKNPTPRIPNVARLLLKRSLARIEALQAEVAAKDVRITGLERDRRNQAVDAGALVDRATAAEAERDAWRERESETQEALQKIGQEFGFIGGEPRVDAVRRVLTEMRAERDALKAEVERVRSDRAFVIGWNDGWEEALKQNLQFPTMLRKMWSGGEVQAWIDKAMAEARAVLSKTKAGG